MNTKFKPKPTQLSDKVDCSSHVVFINLLIYVTSDLDNCVIKLTTIFTELLIINHIFFSLRETNSSAINVPTNIFNDQMPKYYDLVINTSILTTTDFDDFSLSKE